MGEQQTERRGCHTDGGNEQRSAVTHSTFAQAQHSADPSSQPYGQQADRGGFDHRKAQAEHQQRHGQDATARAG